MSYRIKELISKEDFIKTCNESLSMASACAKMGFHFNSFKKLAIEYGCYKPNMCGKGIEKIYHTGYTLEEIFSGKYPEYSTFKLKNKLLKENILENKCSICNISEWNGLSLNMELDHIDGNKYNHSRDNLRMLCPNCHAQTETYRSKKRPECKK